MSRGDRKRKDFQFDVDGDDAETALSREISRVNAITRDITTTGLVATLRESIERGWRDARADAGDAAAGGGEDAGETTREEFARACATLVAVSAMELLARTTMNLMGRRAWLDRACGREEDTLDDASRRAFLGATTGRLANGGARELLDVSRAVVERELRGVERTVLEEGWTRDACEGFMRRCRETMSRALSVPSDVFRDANASARVSFRATPLDSLITHRRMAVACFARPRVDFAHRVLGRRRAAHVKFIHSDDEEDAIVREEDAKDDPSSGDAFALPLNASQRDAAVSFIEARGDADRCRAVVGPPGTGKTRFAASLLARLVATNHRVLVCAPSNKAVCVVMEAYLRARRRRRRDDEDEDEDDDDDDDDDDVVALVGVEEALRDAATEASTMDHFIFQTCEVVARRLKETLDAYTRGEMNAVNVRDAGERARRRLRRRAPDFLAGDVADALDALRRAADDDDDIRDAGARAVASIVRGSSRGDRVDEFASETLRRARVTFCTLASADQSVMAALDRPDVLLVDEAAQALEPELAIAFTRHPRRALLVGDPAQLPASLTSDIARRFGHATSLMERLTKTDADGARALNAQYRMHPEISSWPAREFYDGRVMNAPCVETRARPVGTPRWLPPYVFVDVADGAERGGRGKSKTNEREAQVACDVVARIRGDNDAAKVLSIVVITFYAAQVGRLREALSARGLRDVAARSVDSFQGSEADVVVCSAVRNNPRFNVGFLADRRRLNVALTRAKHALVVVGSRETLARCDADALRRLVEDVDERGLVVSDKDIASSWR